MLEKLFFFFHNLKCECELSEWRRSLCQKGDFPSVSLFVLPSGGIHNIQQHTFGLARYTYMLLSSLCHGNGRPAAQIYAEGQFESPSTQGAILNFNLMDSNGQIIGYSQVNLTNPIFSLPCYCLPFVYVHAGLLQILKNPLLLTGRQDGEFVQHSCAHWLLLQHRRLPILPWDHQSTDEEKPAGMSPKSRVSFQVYILFLYVCCICIYFDLFLERFVPAQK